MPHQCRIKQKFSLAASAAVFIAVTTRLVAATAISTFDTDNEGWTAIGDTATPVVFVTTNGNPPGCAQVEDSVVGGVMYFSAPAKFLGDHSDAYGTDLKFDLMQKYPDSPNQCDDSDGDIILQGGGLTLAYDTAANPANGSWTSYSVPLLETAGWHLTNLSGAAPTQAQFQSVLANLTSLRIRAEYQTGPDTDSIDNVRLGPPDYFLKLTLPDASHLALIWPTNAINWNPESSSSLTSWSALTNVPAVVNTNYVLTINLEKTGGKFFRLHKQ